MSKKLSRPVWIEVDLSSIKHNIKILKQKVSSNTLIMAIIKADAYGHGALPVSRAIKEEVDRLAVALPEEGVELREGGIKVPIQVLGEVLPSQIPLLINYDLIPTICKKETALQLNKFAKEKDIIKKIHIKIDTGMGRIGVKPEDSVKFITEILALSNIEVEGLMTHFAKADEYDKEYTYNQWKKFKSIIEYLENENIYIPIKHAANSATIIDLPEMELNMVRPGIILYGLSPSSEVKDIDLKPALSWKARIMYLKEVPAESGISYGTTFVTSRKSKIATIPLGYADGYYRLLSNKGYVLIKGQKAPVIGRICMDQFMVDVTDIKNVNIGDEVVLIGKQGTEEITATDLANIVGTINYEIVCNIKDRIPRIYKK